MNADDRRRNTPDEMIAVIAAHDRGEKLERRIIAGYTGWCDDDAPSFNFSIVQYRIKSVVPPQLFVLLDSKGRARYGHKDYMNVVAKRSHLCTRFHVDTSKFQVVRYTIAN